MTTQFPELPKKKIPDVDGVARQVVASSQILSLGYCAASLRLHVEFHNGGLYQYRGVDQGRVDSLRAADSIGGYFLKVIRGKYETTKWDGEKFVALDRRKSSPKQRALIEQMLVDAEVVDNAVRPIRSTLFMRPMLKALELDQALIDGARPLAEWLESLWQDEASRVIDWLKEKAA